MPKLPALRGNEVIRVLEKVGFQVIRQKGSHVRMKHEDGRVVTIPVHASKTIGILRSCTRYSTELLAL